MTPTPAAPTDMPPAPPVAETQVAIPHAQAPAPSLRPLVFLAGAVATLACGPVESVALDAIDGDANNPRRPESAESLASLSESIRGSGIIQPLLVTPSPTDGRFDLLDGHRRLAAARLAGLASVPVLVVQTPLTPAQRLQIQLVTSLLRTDLKPCREEAAGYEKLLKTHGYTQTQLAAVTGKTDSLLSRALYLRKLPIDVQDLIDAGERCKSAGVELAKVKNRALRDALLDRFRRTPLTVQQIAAAREPRPGRAENTGGGQSRRITLRLGERGPILAVTCPETLPALTTEALRDALEFALQEVRAALRNKVDVRNIATWLADRPRTRRAPESAAATD